MNPVLHNYLVIGAALFVLGMIGFLTRRNLIIMFLATEVMFQGVLLNLVGFGRFHRGLDGQAFALFLLVVAARELFPEAEVVIDHSLTLSGLFCEVRKATPLTAEEVQRLEERMRAIVAADEPIQRKRVTLSEAEAIFREQGYDDKVRLLPYRQKDYLTIYELRGLADYYYGYMVPSTGYLQHFALRLCPPGLILLFPRPEAPTVLPVLRSYPRLAGVFREYQAWLDLLNVGDVAGLNEAIASGRMREVVLVAEALHAQRIGELANDLEPAAFALTPRLGELHCELERALGRPLRMSGSGSSLFTLYDGQAAAVAGAERLTHVSDARALPVELAPRLLDDLNAMRADA